MTNQDRNARHRTRVDRGVVGPSVSRLAVPVRSAAFWAAVLVPLAYPPVLLDGGAPNLALLCGLLGLHAVALSVGHDHRRP